MKTIYKYPLEITASQVVKIAGLISILSVKCQREKIVLYAFVNSNSSNETTVSIAIVGTGHDANGMDLRYWRFLDTVLMANDQLMFHVFCRIVG